MRTEPEVHTLADRDSDPEYLRWHPVSMSTPPPACPVCGGGREWSGCSHAACYFCGLTGLVEEGALR